jgi:hypothetical protein
LRDALTEAKGSSWLFGFMTFKNNFPLYNRKWRLEKSSKEFLIWSIKGERANANFSEETFRLALPWLLAAQGEGWKIVRNVECRCIGR